MTANIRQDMVDLLPRLRRFAYTLTGTLDEADDIVQAACERALARLDQFTPGTRLDSWMFRIIRTVFLDRMRRSKRQATSGMSDEIEQVGFDARIHEGTAARLDLEKVRREIAKLPEDQREVLALVTVDDMSYQEAAETLGVPIGTVMSRLSRARRKLAMALNERAGEGTQSGLGR